MDGNDLDMNQDDEMNASGQDSAETPGRAAGQDHEGVPGGVADGEPATGPAIEQPGEPPDAADAEGVKEVGGPPGREPEQADELRAERDRLLRLAADFDNYRKRTGDRLRQRWDRAQADLVSRLLDPLDDLLRVTALEPGNASVEAIVEGVDLVERKFFRVLEEAGVEVVDPQGEAFDPNTMEAMMRVPAGSDEDDDMVERVFQRGYTFRGQLVRPARVSVFKA